MSSFPDFPWGTLAMKYGGEYVGLLKAIAELNGDPYIVFGNASPSYAASRFRNHLSVAVKLGQPQGGFFQQTTQYAGAAPKSLKINHGFNDKLLSDYRNSQPALQALDPAVLANIQTLQKTLNDTGLANAYAP